MKKKDKKIISFYSVVLLLLFLFFFYRNLTSQPVYEEIPYLEFVDKLEANNIKEVYINFDNSSFYFEDNDGKYFVTDNPRTEDFKLILLSYNVKVVEQENRVGNVILSFLPLCFYLIIIFVMFSKMRSPLSTPVNKASEDAKVIKFDNIAGHKTLKKDFEYIVDFLKNPDKIKKMGGRMPKGIILYGPPGTGKTLFAKALAGEAEVPFFYANGSDFIEMFVGVGAKRVRALFEQAKKNAPCIVFIDEIDSIGTSRDSKALHSEGEQTINALLSELDGFDVNNGVLTICATNRIENLDKALTRAGRFDRQIAVPLPDIEDREELFNLYMKDKPISEELNAKWLARQTPGFSGADIEAIMNESSIISAQKNHDKITKEDIDDAMFQFILKGTKQSVKNRNEKEFKTVSWHETGHALMSVINTGGGVSRVSILPSSSGAGGATFREDDSTKLKTRRDLLNEIEMLLGGRAAEYVCNDKNMEEVTTGASNDLQKATELAKAFVCDFGFSEDVGLINLNILYKDSLKTSPNVEEAVRKIIEICWTSAVKKLEANKDLLLEISNVLLEKENLDGLDFVALCKDRIKEANEDIA